MANTNSGYHACPCRDCFEIAIGCDDDNTPHLCHECETAGCDADGGGECEAPGAYGGHDGRECENCPTLIPADHCLCEPCAKRDPDPPEFQVNPTPAE